MSTLISKDMWPTAFLEFAELYCGSECSSRKQLGTRTSTSSSPRHCSSAMPRLPRQWPVMCAPSACASLWLQKCHTCQTTAACHVCGPLWLRPPQAPLESSQNAPPAQPVACHVCDTLRRRPPHAPPESSQNAHSCYVTMACHVCGLLRRRPPKAPPDSS